MIFPQDDRNECIVCGKVKPLAAILHKDPFCSTAHARKYYGTEITPEVVDRNPKSYVTKWKTDKKYNGKSKAA